MPITFADSEKAFKKDQITYLAEDAQGVRFLKLRSLSRSEHMERLTSDYDLPVPSGSLGAKLKMLFESRLTNEQIETTIRNIYAEQRHSRSAGEDILVSELYKMNSFDWGGLHQNSLEKTIIDNYVKKIRSFDDLQIAIEERLTHSLKSYVQCSWYNHWTSIIIEDIFKDHPSILPAVGLIKKIDFFVRNVPFDLKVTYLPEGFIKEKRKAASLPEELSVLKKYCRRSKIHYADDLAPARLIEYLWAKVADHPDREAREIIRDLKVKREEILSEAERNPDELIKWLYENQGVRRFDASNRLFLVLVDRDNFFESWKLKRAKDLLVARIHSFLSTSRTIGKTHKFIWEGTEYSVTSGAVFVIHSR